MPNSSDSGAGSNPAVPGFLKGASNVVVADEWALDDPEGLISGTSHESRSCAHRCQGSPTSHNRPPPLTPDYPCPRIGVGVLRECPASTQAHLYAGARYIVVRDLGLECSKRPTPSEYWHPYARFCVWTYEEAPSSTPSGDYGQRTDYFLSPLTTVRGKAARRILRLVGRRDDA
jgi:hypothetical protein